MSSYTDLRKYHDDFRFLKEMKTLMMEEVCRMRAEISDPTFWDSQVRRGFFTETEDGRDVRIVLPKGVHAVTELFHPYVAGHEGVKDLMRSECGITTPTAIHFVGFIGTRLTASQTHEGVEKGVMSMDDVLIAELAEIDGMLAYVTGERVKGGDRGNLVLFRDWGVVHELLKSKNHDAAVRWVVLLVAGFLHLLLFVFFPLVASLSRLFCLFRDHSSQFVCYDLSHEDCCELFTCLQFAMFNITVLSMN